MIALAWRNLWRQPYRTLLSLLAIAFACLVMVFLLSLQIGTYATMKNNSMSLFDSFAQIQTPDYLDEPSIRKSFTNAKHLTQALKTIPGITTVAARTQTFALFSKGSQSLAAMVVGVQPALEAKVSRISTTVYQGRSLHLGDSNAILLGDALARNLKVNLGDQVTLLGMGHDGSVAADVVTIVGIFKTGMKELDRQLVEMPLSRFQSDFAMHGQVNLLALSGKSLQDVDDALPAISKLAKNHHLMVRSWGELEPGLKEAIQLDASTSMLWYAALVVVVVAILLNTIFMSVLERTKEFGILLALGMRPETAGTMVWLEILMMLALGLALGIGLGAAIAGWYSIHGLALPGAEGVFAQWGLPSLMYPKITAFSLLAAPTVVAILTTLAGFFPYFHLRKLEPVSAMRSV